MEQPQAVSERIIGGLSYLKDGVLFGAVMVKDKVDQVRNSEAGASAAQSLSVAKDKVVSTTAAAYTYARETITVENLSWAAEAVKEKGIFVAEKTKELATNVTKPEFRESVVQTAKDAYNSSKRAINQFLTIDDDAETGRNADNVLIKNVVLEEEKLEKETKASAEEKQPILEENETKKEKVIDSDSDSDEEDLGLYQKNAKKFVYGKEKSDAEVADEKTK